MRKITSILLLAWLALAGIMNAQSLPFTPATISDGMFNPGTQYYYIKISNQSKYFYIDGNDVKLTTTKGNADQFAITGNTTDGFKIYKKGDTNNLIYLTNTTSNSVDNVSYGNSNTNNTWTLFNESGRNNAFYQIGPCTTASSKACTLNKHDNETSLWTWTHENAPGSDDCKIVFEIGDVEPAVLITYQFNVNGVESSKEVLAGIGRNFPDIDWPAFCQGTKPEGTVSAEDEGTTKVINVTWNGPFNFSSTVENAKWYLMTLGKAPNGNLPVVRYNPSNQYITLEQGDNTFTYAKNDQWAFVGNPFDGFKIYNRALSGGRLISSTTMTGTEGQNTFPYVSADALQSGYTDTWDVYIQNYSGSQSAIPGGFAISQHGTSANKMNRRWQNRANGGTDYRMAYWTGGSDNGSTFTVSQTSLPNITLNTVNGTSYASFYVDYPVVVTTDNVKVYTGTININGNSLEMTEAGDKIIPANVGVVLISETAATTAEISISNNNGTLLSGDLTGTTTARNINGSQSNYLVLGRDAEDNTKVGFYRPNGTEIPAYKAFISTGGNVQGLAFNFDGATTDINSISATTDKQEIYDLSGRRVMKANKGLYIINGKKCFIK